MGFRLVAGSGAVRPAGMELRSLSRQGESEVGCGAGQSHQSLRIFEIHDAVFTVFDGGGSNNSLARDR
jgi:hypothetical protein